MKKILPLLLTIALASCNSEANKLEKLKAAIEKSFNDAAFKSNMKFDLLKIEGLTYQMVDGSSIDSFRIYNNQSVIDNFTKKVESKQKVLQLNIENIRLSAALGSKPLVETYTNNANEAKEQLHDYMDSLNTYVALDSVLREKIKNPVAGAKNIYKTKFLLRASTGGQNILDTVTIFFNEKIEPIIH